MNLAPSSAPISNHATEIPDGAQQAPVTNHEARATTRYLATKLVTTRVTARDISPRRGSNVNHRALSQAMQCETLDECKDGPSREEQSEQHSSADFPPRGPSKREAALVGAHKSPTKADGVVHKKTRDGRYIRPDGFISYYPPLC